MGGTATGKARVCCALFYQNYIVDVIPWIWVTAYQSWQAISRSQSGVGCKLRKRSRLVEKSLSRVETDMFRLKSTRFARSDNIVCF